MYHMYRRFSNSSSFSHILMATPSYKTSAGTPTAVQSSGILEWAEDPDPRTARLPRRTLGAVEECVPSTTPSPMTELPAMAAIPPINVKLPIEVSCPTMECASTMECAPMLTNPSTRANAPIKLPSPIVQDSSTPAMGCTDDYYSLFKEK